MAEKSSGLLEQSKQVFGVVEDDSLWVDEKTGLYLDLTTSFSGADGQQIRLGDIVDRPTVILPIYFYCPNICSKNLANLAVALGSLSHRPGADYRVIALSFNEAESIADAARAKRNYTKLLDPAFPQDEWHFLTGSKPAIDKALGDLGYRYKKIDDETFIHPAALIVVAGDGKIVRYIYGSFLAGDIDLGIGAAKEGRTALSVKRLLDFCFNYDPNENSSVFQTVKIAVLVFFAVSLLAIYLYYRRKRPQGPKAGSRP